MIYSKEMVDAICSSIAAGESLRTICSWHGMPEITTVMRWRHEHEDFNKLYVMAREAQAELFADDTVDIADNGAEDVVMLGDVPLVIDGKIVKTKTNVSVQHAKLRVDTRKWKAGRMHPKAWGEKVQTDITSGGKPIKNEYHIHPVTTHKPDNGKD